VAGSSRLIEVRDLRVHFPIRRGFLGRRAGVLRAVDGISFEVGRAEALGLVGESGCGKTTAARAALRLVPATAGSVRYFPPEPDARLSRVLGDPSHPAHARDGEGGPGVEVLRAPAREMRALRRHLQIVFQDPYGSLNPRMTAGAILAEPLRVHRLARGAALDAEVARLLERVGLHPEMAGRYPHEFSGGQRQRIGIARALSLRPSFVVLDEPVSALDVSVQAQILALLAELQAVDGLAYLFIAHDLALVRRLCPRVAVMYLGEIVESGPTDRVFTEPLHPYTKALLSAVPIPDPTRRRTRILLSGEPPSPANPPSGCRFHPRCPVAEARCRTEVPFLGTAADGRLVACHLVERRPGARGATSGEGE
jgi:oligopeptide/dipeptide ABC transporter ATP-binding protein